MDLKKYEVFLRERELSENTIRAYTISAKCFFSEFDELSKPNLLAWKSMLYDNGMKPKSINVRLNAMGAYCDMIGHPEYRVKTMRVHQAQAVSNVISSEQYRALLNGLTRDKNFRWYYIVKLMATTGARVSELIRLTKRDFDVGYCDLWTKGKVRRIYIPSSFRTEAADHFANYSMSQTLVCKKDGAPMTTRGVSQMLRTFADRYSIDQKVMHPHSFRHFFAIHFLEQNGNLSLLADIMGHTSISTTAIYTRMTKEQQAMAVNSSVNW